MSTPARPADQPSDPGLAGERTTLAWARMGLTLIGLPSAVLAYAHGRDSGVAVVAASGAMLTGLAILTLSLRRQRAGPGMVDTHESVLAMPLVLLTTLCALLLEVAGIVLVLGR